MNNDNLKLEDLLQDSGVHDNNTQFEYVAIIGAGIMGQGIAQSIAAAGIETIIIEKDEKHLESAKIQLENSMTQQIDRWSMTESEKKSISNRTRESR